MRTTLYRIPALKKAADERFSGVTPLEGNSLQQISVLMQMSHGDVAVDQGVTVHVNVFATVMLPSDAVAVTV